MSGDVSPIDVYSHIPVTLEEAGIPYCYVPSKEVIDKNKI
jgi:ribosomal protein L7Ae-like RNA K-turn-binding protein